MKKKGFATSAILYTILLLFLVLMVGILNNLQNKKTILDQLKVEVLSNMESTDIIDTENPQASINLQSATAYITMTDNTGVFEYAIVAGDEEPTEWIQTENLKSVSIEWSIPQAGTYSVWVKDIYKNVSRTQFTVENSEFCAYQPGEVVKTFDYTGSIQEFSTPCSGVYQIEVWGAQGGTANETYAIGGYGGYAFGTTQLTKSDTIYVYVGGSGQSNNGSNNANILGGYNGGGSTGSYPLTGAQYGNMYTASGGGATHIAYTNRGELVNYEKYLDDLLIVAGGGGGGWFHNNYDYESYGDGGAGGGESGSPGVMNSKKTNYPYGLGGTQSIAGTPSNTTAVNFVYQNGGFGKGASGYTPATSTSGPVPSCGGGGGYYGGGPGAYAGCGGGSGYLNPNQLISGTTGMENGVRSGNGYAKITLISLSD